MARNSNVRPPASTSERLTSHCHCVPLTWTTWAGAEGLAHRPLRYAIGQFEQGMSLRGTPAAINNQKKAVHTH